MARFDHCIEPMSLANMRQLGVRSLVVSCWQCHHEAILSADPWPDDIPVPTFGPRTVAPAAASSAQTRRRIGKNSRGGRR
jgi:hypothetical protein